MLLTEKKVAEGTSELNIKLKMERHNVMTRTSPTLLLGNGADLTVPKLGIRKS
jgi:hypothetical protein